MSRTPAQGRARALLPLLIVFLSIVAPRAAGAAEIYSGFHIRLDDVSRLYDSLYRDRITDQLDVDSTVTFDWKHARLGNQRYRVKTFLPTDYSPTRDVVDYLVVPGYRARFTVPRAAFFETTTRDVGDLSFTEPRDFSIPDLRVELTPTDEVATQIERASRAQVWKDTVRQSVTSLPSPTESQAAGIKFQIPIPIPKRLESIFGPGEKTNITVRGREEITIAGETSVVKPFIGVEGRENQSLFPSLDMQQKLDVSLKGTIGDKVEIQVDHSSEALSDNANRVRLAYKGYEDEVIQLIELGNTSLSLPGSQLVSVSTGAQGLFGVKMLAKTGSTDLTLIASKQEGEVSSAAFSPAGGTLGQAEERVIRDVDYVKDKYFYFDLNIPATEQGLEVYRTVTPQDLIIDPTIQRIPGWVMPDPIGDGQSIRDAAAVLNATGTLPPETALRQDFELLQVGEDYDFILDANSSAVIGLELFDPVPTTALKAIGVVYVNANGTRVGGSYNTLGVIDTTTGQPPPPNSAGDLLMLKMLKAPDPSPRGHFSSTWKLMIRNFYNLGLTNIDGNSLDVTIEDILNPRLDPTTPEGANVQYLRIFGLDQTDRSGASAKPDNVIDLRWVDLTRGILQFPWPESFIPPLDSVTAWTDTTFTFTGAYEAQYDTSRAIYDRKLNPTQEQEVHQYLIRVSAVSTSKSFRINALNIVEGSETIKIGSDLLARGVDYDIDYETGEVTLKESALARLTPTSKINIDYQFKPLGGLGSSTLAGMSTASKLGENVRIGTTLLYESRSSSDTHPRLGEEPTRAVVGGVTASYQHQSRLLTDLANLLPYVDSDAPSTINLDGEIAASFPNPNTKHEAYIEDFEGVEDADRITLSRRSWYQASLPIDSLGVVKPAADRTGFIWYNIEPERGVHRRDLNPELDVKENTLVQSMDIDVDSIPGDPEAFAGVMLGFPSGGLDISQGQFLEIWVNDFKPYATALAARGGKLHIDLGIIDENFFEPENTDPNTNFNDEDKNRDGFAAAFDDTGLDGKFNDTEPSLPGGTPEDPSGDDIDLGKIEGRYARVNGTEANILYDTEDLDRNGQLTRDNAYFSYVIDLADSADVDISRQYASDPRWIELTGKPGHKNDAWRLYRVKLTNRTVVSSGGLQPRLDEIRHVRVWFDSVDDVVRNDIAGSDGGRRIQITEFSIQGNRWENDGIRDLSEKIDSLSTAQFAIGAISTKTDPGVYHPPVVPNQKNEVSDKESSLALRYQDLPQATQVRILKRFLGSGQDLTLYRDLNFWVHTDSLRTGVEYYFRMGSNETNFYEIIVPFTSTYYNETGWSRVALKLADITGLKFAPADSVVTGTAPDAAEPGRAYPIRMVGIPNLQSVRFLYAGVRNVSNPNPQRGEVWMDDIYTGDVLRDFDHAERLSANVSLAGGALSVGGNWARTGADYRGLRQKRGSGNDFTTLSLNARTDLQYFVPLAGFSIPVAVGHTHNKSLPKFPPNSDTEIVDPEVSDSLRTEQTTRSFSTSLARRNPSKNILMRYTFDHLHPNFSYSDSRSRSPSTRDTTNTMTGSVNYQINWTAGKTLPLFGRNRIRWWLNSFDFTSTGTRTTGRSWSYRNGEFRPNPTDYSATLRNQGAVRYEPFRSLETSYSMFINRDAAIPHEWLGVDVGTEVGRGNNARASFVPPRTWYGVGLFEPSVEVQSTYTEDSSPNVRRPGDPKGTLNASASRSDTGRMRFDLGHHMETLFRWFGWNPGDDEAGKGGARQPPPGGAPVTPPAQPPGASPAPADTTKAKPSKPGLGSLVRGVGRALTHIRPISGNFQHRSSSSYLRIPDRPDLGYRLGMDSDAGILVKGKPIGGPDQKRDNLSFNVDSGVELGKGFDLQGRYTRATTNTDFRTNQSRTVAVTWPDLQASWDGLGKFKPLQPVLATGQFNVSWRETHQESGPRNQDPVQFNNTFSLTPALVMGWKNQLNSTFNVSYTENSSETRGSKSTTNNLSVNLDLKRDFRGGGGIKFFGKSMNWNNTLETNLTLAYGKTGGERSTAGATTEPIPSTNTFRVAPTVRYTFSRNVNGSAFIDFSRQYAEATKQTTTTVRVGVTAVVNF